MMEQSYEGARPENNKMETGNYENQIFPKFNINRFRPVSLNLPAYMKFALH